MATKSSTECEIRVLHAFCRAAAERPRPPTPLAVTDEEMQGFVCFVLACQSANAQLISVYVQLNSSADMRRTIALGGLLRQLSPEAARLIVLPSAASVSLQAPAAACNDIAATLRSPAAAISCRQLCTSRPAAAPLHIEDEPYNRQAQSPADALQYMPGGLSTRCLHVCSN